MRGFIHYFERKRKGMRINYPNIILFACALKQKYGWREKTIILIVKKGPVFRTHNQIFELEFQSEQVFPKNINLILTRYIPYIRNILNLAKIQKLECTYILRQKMYFLRSKTYVLRQKCSFWGFTSFATNFVISLQNFCETILLGYIPYIQYIWNIPSFEFCENMKVGIFCLSQGLIVKHTV